MDSFLSGRISAGQFLGLGPGMQGAPCVPRKNACGYSKAMWGLQFVAAALHHGVSMTAEGFRAIAALYWNRRPHYDAMKLPPSSSSHSLSVEATDAKLSRNARGRKHTVFLHVSARLNKINAAVSVQLTGQNNKGFCSENAFCWKISNDWSIIAVIYDALNFSNQGFCFLPFWICI